MVPSAAGDSYDTLRHESSPPLPLRVVYRIDVAESICHVDEGFRQAAVAAGVDDLPDRVLGTPLIDHLTGEPTKHWYRQLLDYVKQHGTASFEFNCDTPTVIRLLRMEMLRLPDGSITFTAQTLSTRARAYTKVLDWTLPRSNKRILMCSLCNRISSVIGWTDIEQAAQVIQVFEEPIPPAITYTICDDDRARLRELIHERLR